MKLRVGFNAKYLWDYNLRGFNRYTFCLLKQLLEQDSLEVVLFTERRSPIHPAFAQALRVETVLLPSPTSLVWEQIVLPVALRRHQIQLFHAPADGGVPAGRVCPYVLTYHHAADRSFEYLIRKGELSGHLADYLTHERGIRGRYLKYRHAVLRWIYLRRATRVIAVSQYGKWELVELLGVPEHKVEVIYEAADSSFRAPIPAAAVEAVRMKYGLPRGYLLFVGGFDRRKNVEGLLRTFIEAQKAGIGESLVLVGNGADLVGTKALARSLGLEDGRDVVFLGRIHEDLPALYRAATAFITLSWGESFCFPVVEAMSCGTPVIASKLGAIPEILASGGILVDPRNTSETVQAIKAVTSRNELRAQLRAMGLRRAQEFSWNKTAQQTAKVYQEAFHLSRNRGFLQ